MDDNQIRVKQEDPSPFYMKGGDDTGVLLLHSFSGTPREMSRLGRYLQQRGLTVSAPLLPGHGSTLDEMNQYKWQDWAAATFQAYEVLQQSCDNVFVAGFSMGSLLAHWLAITNTALRGIILYSPAIKVANWQICFTPFLRHFISSISRERESDLKDPTVEELLGGFSRYPVSAAAELYRLQRFISRRFQEISTPACVIYSVRDQSIHPQSGPLTVRKLSEVVPVETMVLYDSGHAVVVDQEWETVAQQTYRFIQKHII